MNNDDNNSINFKGHLMTAPAPDAEGHAIRSSR